MTFESVKKIQFGTSLAFRKVGVFEKTEGKTKIVMDRSVPESIVHKMLTVYIEISIT